MSNEELIKELNICRMSQVVMDNTIADLEAKLATCEKYRDAYAEMGRIGTQAVRDLDAKLTKAVEALDDLLDAITAEDRFGDRSLTITGPTANLKWLFDAEDTARATLAEIKGESHD